MKHFTHCHTLEALKAEYKRLVKIHHPDIGGDPEIMKAINAEYDDAVKCMANDPGHADTKRAQRETPEAFRTVVSALVKIPGIDIELCGTWIWVTGDTYTQRDAIKRVGCKWANRKHAWYWHDEGDNSRSRKEMSLDEIRRLHGSELIASTKGERRVLLQA